MIDPSHLNLLSALVFGFALIGVVINLNNLIKVFLSIELMLLAVSINFIGHAYRLNNIDGHVFTLVLLTVAAAESAVGLGILVFYFRRRFTASVVDANLLKE